MIIYVELHLFISGLSFQFVGSSDLNNFSPWHECSSTLKSLRQPHLVLRCSLETQESSLCLSPSLKTRLLVSQKQHSDFFLSGPFSCFLSFLWGRLEDALHFRHFIWDVLLREESLLRLVSPWSHVIDSVLWNIVDASLLRTHLNLRSKRRRVYIRVCGTLPWRHSSPCERAAVCLSPFCF